MMHLPNSDYHDGFPSIKRIHLSLIYYIVVLKAMSMIRYSV